MVWKVLDVTEMITFASNTFDLVIDKSTIDCLFCKNDYNEKVASMLNETHRVLKPGGFYFCVSLGQPEYRGYHFKKRFLNWDLKEYILDDGS